MSTGRSKLIKISSDDRSLTTDGHSKFAVNLHNEDLDKVSKIVLVSAVLQNTQLNINSNNNTLDYKDHLAADQSITVPVGNYTLAELITDITTQDAKFGITESTLTGLLSFTYNGGSSFSIYTTGTINSTVGIMSSSTLTGTTITGSNIPNLNGLDYIQLFSNSLSSNSCIQSDKKNTSLLGIIPCADVSFGDHITYNYNGVSESFIQIYPTVRSINSIDIELKDEENNTIAITSPVIMVFKCYY